MLMLSNNFGVELEDNQKPLSVENKAISYHLFGVCPKCNQRTKLTSNMFTDSHTRKGHGETGWKYTCVCGNPMFYFESFFDEDLEHLWEEDLLIDEEEDN